MDNAIAKIEIDLPYKTKKKLDKKKLIFTIPLTLYALFAIYPIFWLFYNSLKDDDAFWTNAFALFDITNLQWQNYVDSWVEMGIAKFTVNSLIISVLSVVFSLIISSMAAYAIARLKWKYSGATLNYFLLGMMIPIHAILVPLFLYYRSMINQGLPESQFTVVLPYVAFALPTSIFILIGFFETIPKELEEAAVIDGCSVYRIFWNMIIPLTKPAFVTIAVFNFLGAWNELLMALVLLSKAEFMTLPVGLLNFRGMYGSMMTKMFAAIVVSIIPSLLIYFTLQEKITKGMITGAVKG